MQETLNKTDRVAAQITLTLLDDQRTHIDAKGTNQELICLLGAIMMGDPQFKGMVEIAYDLVSQNNNLE